MNIAAISLSDLSNAQKIANEIKQEIKIICSDIFKSEKTTIQVENPIHERKQGPKKMIQLSLTDEQLRLTDTDQLLTPTHRSMLTYWQFSKDYDCDLVVNCNNVRVILRKVLRYLNEQELSVDCDETATGYPFTDGSRHRRIAGCGSNWLLHQIRINSTGTISEIP